MMLPALGRTPVRLVASLAALTLGLSLAPAALAADYDPRSTPRSALATDWQADELTNGAMVNDQFDFVDYGLTIDTLFSLVADGRKLRHISRVGTRLERNAEAYTTFDGTRFAGASAKLLVAARVLREPVRNFGDRNRRLDVLRLVAGRAAGSEHGRIRDSSARGGGGDFSNNIGQSYGVIGLSRTGGVPAPVVTYLLKQQCDNGGFRQDPVVGKSCVRSGGRSNVDTTALALQALVTAKERGGVRVPSRRIVRATRYLARMQKDNGSFTLGRPQGPSNSNSTGLAAQALSTAGRPCLAEATRAWMRTVQIVAPKAGDGPARRDIGAIAFTRGSLKVALEKGVTTATRDEFRRATAQAVFAFTPVGLDELTAAR